MSLQTLGLPNIITHQTNLICSCKLNPVWRLYLCFNFWHVAMILQLSQSGTSHYKHVLMIHKCQEFVCVDISQIVNTPFSRKRLLKELHVKLGFASRCLGSKEGSKMCQNI